jgi:hypothetical protein
MTFLHAVFAQALANEWTERNPVVGAARPKRRRHGDANPDLQFLTIEQLDRVLAEIPDDVVAASRAPTRRWRWSAVSAPAYAGIAPRPSCGTRSGRTGRSVLFIPHSTTLVSRAIRTATRACRD